MAGFPSSEELLNYAYLAEKRYRNFELAKDLYRETLAFDPGNPDIHLGLANLLEEHLGDYEGAKRHYELALELRPESPIAHFCLARLLEKQFSNVGEAKNHYFEVLSTSPSLLNSLIKLETKNGSATPTMESLLQSTNPPERK